MNKAIATLGVNDPSSLVIEKNLTQRNIEGTFNELLSYMTDPREDEYNPSYNGDPDRLRLAGRIRLWMDEMRSSRADKAAFNLFYKDSHGCLSDPLNLEARVGDHLGRILKPSRIETGHGIREYHQAEFVFQYSPSGG